jgi:basic membrane protein A
LSRAKLSRFLSILLLVSILPAACNLPSADCARQEVFCVGLVTGYGGVDDHGLNQSTWEGIQQALSEGLIDKADAIETVDARDRAKNIQTFLEQDYDLVVTTGYSTGEDTRLAAQQWTERLFIGVDQPVGETLPNLATLVFPEDQGGFLAGALAALITNTGKVAAICEVQSLPSMWRYCEGFRVGARFIKADMHPRVIYKSESATSELFKDPAWGGEQALTFLKDGVDILFAAGGDTALGALEGAASNGVYVIGAEEDVYYQLEGAEQVLSSVIRNAKTGIYILLRQTKEGKFPAGEMRGEYSLAPYHNLERQVPVTVQEQLEQIRASLANDSIKTGVPEEP